MPDIMTLATIPAILAVVNLAKTLGLKGKWSALLAVILGALFALADTYVLYGIVSPRVTLAQAITGLITGLSAAGLYDVTSGPVSTSRGEGKHHA